MTDATRAGFGSLLSQTTRSWRRAVNRRLQPYGLTEATWLPLLHVSRASAPMRQKDLAASLGLDGSSVVRVLDALQAAGLVTRREEDADRRAKAIVLTPLGQSTVQQVEQVAIQVREAALAGIADRELQRAVRLLQDICQRLDAEANPDTGEAP
ncbi:MarR family winged helix-turn-helix transcriptional regulator [Bordetella genomosp. 13]|uniref:MarR family transcriptional regulator n=1 Tax=Bordetella genomosp. 13 TaxID=463040 RepID=A0A1W6Z956_9BORD|nr:MarR family transcriptional regulator [Bordetella genomosp. 13]ARP93871.1 MarR family transcriptional regulator [Bordetella genomosp. 13]